MEGCIFRVLRYGVLIVLFDSQQVFCLDEYVTIFCTDTCSLLFPPNGRRWCLFIGSAVLLMHVLRNTIYHPVSCFGLLCMYVHTLRSTYRVPTVYQIARRDPILHQPKRTVHSKVATSLSTRLCRFSRLRPSKLHFGGRIAMFSR